MTEKDCMYCGEEVAQVEIINPNYDDKEPFWKVCITCKKIIKEQQRLAFGYLIKNQFKDDTIGNKIIKEANDNIDKLSYESGKETFSLLFKRKQEVRSEGK